jgi:tRNA-dihydrouridine synthase
LRRELGIPVAGNGDISCARELIRRTGYITSDLNTGKKRRRGSDLPVHGLTAANDLIENDLSTEGLCAAMVGRAAVRQPWIFSEAISLLREYPAPGSDAEDEQSLNSNSLCLRNIDLVFETGLRFLELLVRFQPPEFHISRARRFFAFFCDNLKWGNYLKNLLNREESLGGIERVWRMYFTEQRE